MNELQNFRFEGNEIRTIQAQDLIWFAAKDATNNLGLSNTTMAIRNLDTDEVTKFNLGGLSGETNFISEAGLYKLIGASRKPQAKKFNRWVTHEVLPNIRRNGAYVTPQTAEDWLNNPDMMIDVLKRYKDVQSELQEEHTHRLIAEQQVNELQPKATYYDLILRNKSLYSVSQISKDYGMSAKKMNKLLHEFGVQFKQGGVWLLYAKYQDKGYTQTSTYALDEEHSKVNTKWTQSGRIFIYELLKDKNILPMIEQAS